MRTTFGFTLPALFILFASSSLPAYDGLELYNCRISAHDQVNSAGTRLTSIADILAQDRANYHRFGKRDAADTGDGTFTTQAARRVFHSATITISPALRRKLLSGQVTNIHVYVFTKDKIEVVEGLLDFSKY